MRVYDDYEQMLRVWDVEEIKKLANKRVYYQINQWAEKELDELWTKERADTASFGENTGFYVGMETIRGWYTTLPSGTGCYTAHPITTAVVELAGDGQTARGLWTCIGQETVPGKAMWLLGKVAMDFVRENGAWKIWHVVEANDISSEAGTNYSEGDPYWEPETDPVVAAFGEPTIKALTHDPNFNWWDNYPAPPQPYETFTEDESYGPEGFKGTYNKGLEVKQGGNYI